MKKRKNRIIIIMCMMIFFLSGCSEKSTKIVLHTGFARDEVFRIEEMSCSLPELMVYLTTTQSRYEKVYGEQIWETSLNGVSLEENMKDMVLAQLSQIKAMNLLAVQEQVELSVEEKELTEEAASAFYETLTKEERKNLNVDKDLIKRLYQEYALANKVYYHIIQDVNPEVSDDEARTITVDHILIKTYSLDENNQKVDGVIVQLIEIRSKASGGLGEYIWQQTVSGSNKVKSLTNQGNGAEIYDNTVETGSGEYEFIGFVPGNYIIRYIYGDGTTKDVELDVKYNGQDYKSTKDPNYQAPLYNTAEYADGSSVARDNEARRLEVMAYSTTIDAKIGQALNTFSKNMENLTDGEKAVLKSYYNSLMEDGSNASEIGFAYNASKGDAYAGNPVPATLSDDEIYNLLKYYVSYKTWMSAETSMINVPIDTEETSIDTNSTQVGIAYEESKVTFENMNFGLALRPNTKLVLEKHITGLKITPSGTGVQPIVDARADITQILGEGDIETTGITTGLATIESTRTERGFWKVETDIEELAQGAQLEVEYTYVIRNGGEEKDYLSKILVNAYEGYQTNNDGTRSGEKLDKSYKEYLESLVYDTRGKTNAYGTYLGQHYYTGDVGTTDAEVSSRVEGLEEALNNQLKYDDAGDYFEITNKDDEGKVISVSRNIYDTDGKLVDNVGNGIKNIETVVNAEETSDFLKTTEKDYSKTIRLTTVLSSVTGDAGYYPSYIAEITQYSNAAGRRNMEAEPENLSYIHSEDNEMTMNSVTYELAGETHEARNIEEVPDSATVIRQANEADEFWGESIIISKPTGEDKLTGIQIAVILTISVAILGVGIVLIKKFVLKK